MNLITIKVHGLLCMYCMYFVCMEKSRVQFQLIRQVISSQQVHKRTGTNCKLQVKELRANQLLFNTKLFSYCISNKHQVSSIMECWPAEAEKRTGILLIAHVSYTQLLFYNEPAANEFS